MRITASFSAFLMAILVQSTCRADDDFDKAREILLKADSWELLSLNADLTIADRITRFVDSFVPSFLDFDSNSKYFHNWPVRGKTIIRNVDTRTQLLAALDQGIREKEEMLTYREFFALARVCGPVIYEMPEVRDRGGFVLTGCFDPRHGIVATHGGKRIELLICFECSHFKIFGDVTSIRVWISKSPRDRFDDVLKDAKVPLGPRPKKPPDEK